MSNGDTAWTADKHHGTQINEVGQNTTGQMPNAQFTFGVNNIGGNDQILTNISSTRGEKNKDSSNNSGSTQDKTANNQQDGDAQTKMLMTRMSSMRLQKAKESSDDEDDWNESPKFRKGNKKQEADESEDDSDEDHGDEEFDQIVSLNSQNSNNPQIGGGQGIAGGDVKNAKSEHLTEGTMEQGLQDGNITYPDNNVVDLVSFHSKYSKQQPQHMHMLWTPQRSVNSNKLSIKQKVQMNSAFRKVSFFQLNPEKQLLASDQNNSMCDSTGKAEHASNNNKFFSIDAMNKSIEQSASEGESSQKMKRNIKSFNYTQFQLNTLMHGSTTTNNN